MENNIVSWPGWKVVRLIGEGSFGAVYEIQRNTFGNIEKAALKVISIPKSKRDIEELYNDGYDDASITARFNSFLEDIVREYSLMVEMKGHTNVVYCDDLRYVQSEDGFGWNIYIKMELLTPLPKILRSEIAQEDVIQLGIDICKALVLCKSRNIVHRDIKPQNIFVSKDGNFKLGDFGIAKTAERTTSGTKVGTYKYMAPEVYNNQPYGSAADIYSLGLVLYWMLNERRTPFLPLPPQVPTTGMEEESRRRRFSGEAIPVPLHGSEELKRIVLKACAYDLHERYTSAAEMLEDLQALRTDKGMPISAAASAVAAVKETAPEVQEVGEGTENIFGARRGTAPDDAATEYLPQDRTEYLPRAEVKETKEKEPQKKQKKPGKLLAIIGAAAALILLILLLLHSCKPGGPAEPEQTDPTNSSENQLNLRTVSDLEGLTESYAEGMLTALGFVVEKTYQTDDSVGAGLVISQSAAADTQLEEGSVVTLVISSGKPTVDVENVVGKPQEEAVSLLEAQGFVVEVSAQYSSTVASGTVISQSPVAGDSLYAGETVTIYVSKGPAPVGVTGVSVDRTSAELETGAGLQLSATVQPSNADNQRVYWTSSDRSVVTVSESGYVTAVAPGSAIITVKTEDGEKTATVLISVSNPTVTVTLNVNGGSGSNETLTVRHNEKYGTLPTPKRDYYTFVGWYTAATGGTKVTSVSTVSTKSAHTLYARWELNPSSSWVLASNAPSDAMVVKKKWTYTLTETTESTDTSMAGWTQTGSYWSQTGTGSAYYASFPSGFQTTHSIYTSFLKSAYAASETETTKREVSSSWAGYVYWHWMYDCNKANAYSRAIYNQYGYGPTNGYLYKYFGAFTSSTSYDSTTGYCNNLGVKVYYNTGRTSYADSQGSKFWFRFNYYTTTYTDYVKIFTYEKITTGKESTTEVKESDSISNVQVYIQYRKK